MPKGIRIRRRERRIPWLSLVMGGLIVAGGLAMLFGKAVTWDWKTSRANAAADSWQRAYWRRPIAPQGPVPFGYIPEAAGLKSGNCALCHPAQASDWTQSRHGAAMGPGVAGQLLGMGAADRGECLECHAPLSEQWADLRTADSWTVNPAYDRQLMNEGVVCAACHLRAHIRHGPPLAEGKVGISQVYHGQPVRTPHFEASEFCAGCHQHAADTQTPGGKVVENTYQEWLQSPAAADGKTCQSCHMPDRRHLWRGIHDPEMTRSGTTIETDVQPRQPREGEALLARLTVKNTGVGHAFPTYTTPAVYLRAEFLDEAGRHLPGTAVAELVLQRRLDMTAEPWGEASDTRVLPGKAATLTVDQIVPMRARSLRYWIVIEPDRFYSEFFRERLAEGPAPEAAKQYRVALTKAQRSSYVLFDTTIPIVAGNGHGR